MPSQPNSPAPSHRTSLKQRARNKFKSWFGSTSSQPKSEGGNNGEEELQLDEEMEKVFQREPERLDVSRLTDMQPRRDSEGRRRHFGSPISASDLSQDTNTPSREFGSSGSDSVVLDKALSPSETPYSSPDRKVQFGAGSPEPNGSNSDATDPTLSEDSERTQKRKSHHHHQIKGRKYSLQEEARRRRGSEGGRRVSIQPEDEPLDEEYQQELESHRSDDPRALSRSKLQPKVSGASIIQIGRKDGNDQLQNILPSTTYKKMYDHSPHSVFVQLDELLSTEGGEEWKETARWIKYEEDVEEGSDRWGRPHVASLSFHSLLNLRRCLETGVVLLDLDEKDLPGVAYRVVEKMVSEELIEEDDKPIVMRSLLLRHRHVNGHDRGFRFSISGRKHSSYTSLQNISDQQKSRRGSSISYAKKFEPLDPTHKIDIKEEVYTASQEELKRSHNDSILKRIPEGSEATTVLVGAVGFLDQPTIAFVRLAQGILMPSITEVPIPVRFMFILLGPASADLDYHEIGRSISTLMSNPQFHKIAYKADDRKDLLSAINEFLDDSIVLPPGDWDRHALLPFDEFKAKSDMIKRRKQSVIDRKIATAAAAGLIPPLITMDEQKKALLEQEYQMPQKHKVNPLERTGVPFGGLINDIKRRYPYYLSDFKDALNGSCVAATIFMYFAAVSSAITFGGLLNAKTHGWIGISETLVFTCVGGIVFALLGGQPLMITGATGPLLLFDESLFHFCESQQIDYLVARMYMGLWIVVIAITVACFEGSVLVKRFTRFTEDIFASLISLIFIAEPIQKLIEIYKDHPLLSSYCDLNSTNSEQNSVMIPVPLQGSNLTSTVMSEVSNNTNLATLMPAIENATKSVNDISGDVPQPNTALFCTMLTLGTFTIAYYLRIFRNGKFLGRSARRALGDFGVPIAIIIMVLVACLLDQVFTETLRVPEGLSPSMPGRNWLVFTLDGNADFPVWAMFATAAPALMVYIIVFMETHIAELIIDKPERNLKKGSGFHMDIVLVSLVNCICGMTGAPWQCVATVRSVSHVSALTIMSTTHAPGDKPYIVEVKEQRLTGLLVSLLVGLSVLMSRYLRLVPIAVLFGVFLYMGISSINGIQFFDRLILFFKPVKHHPQVPYVRRVPTIKMHLFTLIQLIALGVLYVVKSSTISLAFPFFLIMMVPLRSALQYVFTPLELRALDGKTPEKDQDDEPDFYEEAPLPG